MESSYKKVCGYCGMHIPPMAIKCPYCHCNPDPSFKYPTWWYNFWMHPFWETKLGMTVLVLFWVGVMGGIFYYFTH